MHMQSSLGFALALGVIPAVSSLVCPVVDEISVGGWKGSGLAYKCSRGWELLSTWVLYYVYHLRYA